MEKLNRNQTRYGDIQRVGIDLENSLEKCKTVNNNELFKYVDTLMNYVSKIKNLFPEVQGVSIKNTVKKMLIYLVNKFPKHFSRLKN